MKSRAVMVVAGLAICSCSPSADEQPATLYRNSSADFAMRVHWATFDADERNNYNLNNCNMAARLLNANLDASGNTRPQEFGFWCEPGEYREEGSVPYNFQSAFPTDA